MARYTSRSITTRGNGYRDSYGRGEMRELRSARDAIARAAARESAFKMDRAETAREATGLAIGLGAAGLSGLLQTRFGITSIGPIPIGLGAGALMALGGLFMSGRYSDGLLAAGGGLLAVEAAKLGAQLGASWRARSMPLGAPLAPGAVQGSVGNWPAGYGYPASGAMGYGYPAPAYGVPAMAAGYVQPGYGYGVPMSDAELVNMVRQQAGVMG